MVSEIKNFLANIMVASLGDAALSGVSAANRFFMIAPLATLQEN